MSVIVRRLLVLGLALAAALALPGASWATVRGGCLVTGSATSSGLIDITTETEWHMKSTDIAGGSGTAPSPQTSSTVVAYVLGIAIPITSGSGDGSAEGSVDGVDVSTFAILGARFMVAGSSSGDAGGCDGEVTVILDDVNPLLTVLGGGGILLALLGLVAIILAARSSGGGLLRLLAAVFGGLDGAGLGLALEQFGFLDPRLLIGLVIAIGGALAGFVLAGRFAIERPIIE
jgi:hypothetical protein